MMHSSRFTVRSIRPVTASAVAASAITILASSDVNLATIPKSEVEGCRSDRIKHKLFSSIRSFWRSQNVTKAIAPPTAHATSTNRRDFFRRPTPCECDSGPPEPSSKPPSISSTPPPPLSRTALLLYRLNLKSHASLPTPRCLTPSDPLFAYPQLTRGLKRRQIDETRLHRLLSSPEAAQARKSRDPSKTNALFEEMNALVYGKGVSPQDREDFLTRFGCTGHTPEILAYLTNEVGNKRGFVEVGAGNGQWARALSDVRNDGGEGEFVLAYDSMRELPLNPQIYHGNTVPARSYFYGRVRECVSHVDAVRGYPARGRVLLLVYPPPGPMALETVEAYANAHPENDTIVYVGEGLGGANADDDFFRYFLGMDGGDTGDGRDSKEQHQQQQQQQQNQNQNQKRIHQWAVVKVMDVLSSPGGKGFEKLFVFKKVV
ncbi:hypothetical protein ACHAXS_013635 [Conticribra weissflogii]